MGGLVTAGLGLAGSIVGAAKGGGGEAGEAKESKKEKKAKKQQEQQQMMMQMMQMRQQQQMMATIQTAIQSAKGGQQSQGALPGQAAAGAGAGGRF